MKILLTLCVLLVGSFAWASEHPASMPAAANSVKGKVLEVKDVDSYTYLRLKTENGETWAAVAKAPVKQGADVTVENAMVMRNFASKSLNKTFPSIIFGNLGGMAGSSSNGGMDMAKAHAGLSKSVEVGDAHVAKAVGANARTVAEIMTKSATLKDKPVLLRGKVVKYNPGIMGKNWVHLRDGSGSAKDSTNDILVTTMNQTKVGAVVTAKGIVRTNKDFGAGYAYAVVIEEATLQP